MRREEELPPSYSEINNSNISIIPIPYYTSNSRSSSNSNNNTNNARQIDDRTSRFN